MSVFTEKCVAAYQVDAIAMRIAAGDDPPGIVNAKADRANDESGDRFHGGI